MNEQTEVLPTAHYIFKEIIHVRVPYLQMRSIEDLQFFGMPHSGNDRFDRQTPHEHIDIMIPISQMVEYYQRGAQLFFPLASDTKRVYDYISDHLTAWKRHISRSLNWADAPIEDLKLLDEFANAIYAHAKYQFTDEIINSITKSSGKANRISGIVAALRTPMDVVPVKSAPVGPGITFFNDSAVVAQQAQQPEPEVPEQKFPERESIKDFLDDRKLQSRSSLNGPYDEQQNSGGLQRQVISRDGLSYQSLLRKGRSWR